MCDVVIVLVVVCLKGTVPAASSLKSEFICHPSYDCPASAQFLLVVRNKNANPANGSQHNVLTLIPEVISIQFSYICLLSISYLQFNKPHCKFREKRLLFGTVPLNLTTVKTVHIENKGNCHAYFKVFMSVILCQNDNTVTNNLHRSEMPLPILG